MVGEIGQQAAIVYYVARDPRRARDYVATSRAIMIVTGTVAAVAGFLIAPTLSHDHPGQTFAYRVLFACAPVAFVAASYLFALQARAIRRWVVTRAIQPTVYLALIVALVVGRRLTLDAAALVVVTSIVVQAIVARHFCAQAGLLRGASTAAWVALCLATERASSLRRAPRRSIPTSIKWCSPRRCRLLHSDSIPWPPH